MMQYNRLGKSNLKVSALCLGTMMFGDQTGIDEARQIVAAAAANGINFIDTADVYKNGASEEMVGKLLQGTRHDWVVATKLGNAMGQGPNQGQYSRNWMLRGLEQSLCAWGWIMSTSCTCIAIILEPIWKKRYRLWAI